MTSAAQVRATLQRVAAEPYGRARSAATERLLRRAEALDDADLCVEVRLALVEAYIGGDEAARAFTPFAAALAAHDRGAGASHTAVLHWLFKNILWCVTEFPEVPRARIEALLDDMEARFASAGHTRGPVHQHRAIVAEHVGDRATAEHQLRRWGAARPGAMSDCAGCEPSTRVALLARLGRHEEAVEAARGVLTGRLGCREQPQGVLTALLAPYVHTGRVPEAVSAHRRALPRVEGHTRDLYQVADHLTFCVHTGNEVRGLEIVDRHLPLLDADPSPWQAMVFCASAARVLGRLEEEGHGDAPATSAGPGAAPGTVAGLHEDLTVRARTTAARFDRRNASDHVGRRVEVLLAAPRLVDRVPLTGPGT